MLMCPLGDIIFSAAAPITLLVMPMMVPCLALLISLQDGREVMRDVRGKGLNGPPFGEECIEISMEVMRMDGLPVGLQRLDQSDPTITE